MTIENSSDTKSRNSHSTMTSSSSGERQDYDSKLKMINYKGLVTINVFSELIHTSKAIDKTKQFMWLMTSRGDLSFIRPYGFGKTTTLHAIQEIAKGETYKEKFKGTYIYDKAMTNPEGKFIDINGNLLDVGIPYSWPKYPVLYFDFSAICGNLEQITTQILRCLYKIVKIYKRSDLIETPIQRINRLNKNIDRFNPSMTDKKIEESESFSGDLGSQFTSEIQLYLEQVLDILTELGDGYDEKVIVLIDEYDSILWNKNETDIKHQQIEQLVEGFYTTLKKRSGDIKVTVITGVTRLKVARMPSPISGNTINLNDSYATLVGYTYNEIYGGFPDCAFRDLYKNLKFEEEKEGKKENEENEEKEDSEQSPIDILKNKVMKELVLWYGGYQFSENSEQIFNTYSVNMCFRDSKLRKYWSDLVRGDFQWEIIKDNIGIFKEFEAKGYIKDVEDTALTAIERGCTTDKDKVCATLFQTGLATIKSYRLTEKKKPCTQ